MKFEVEIKKTEFCDVLVVGGGVAGFAAAVAAARQGAKVILTEENSYLGGTATAGLVAPFMTSFNQAGDTQLIRGVFADLVDRLVAIGGAIPPAECRNGSSYAAYKLKGHNGVTPVDKEKLKLVMERMCREAGVILKYRYLFVGAETVGRRITACTFATGNGFYRMEAKAVIDCTGDATVCHMAGGETMFSDESGAVQPVSTFFLIDNVDKQVLDDLLLPSDDERLRAFMDIIADEREKNGFPCNGLKVRAYELPNGVWSINMCQIDRNLDPTDPEQMIEAEIEGREQAHAIFDFLVRRIPGMQNARLMQTSDRVGVRESRRIVGEYVLTHADMLESRVPEDSIAIVASTVDVHTHDNSKRIEFSTLDHYGIPYRCLVARDFDNVWSAGKTVSSDRLAHSAIRVMPPCMAMGHAAGIAAAMASQTGVAAKDLPIRELRENLLAQGAYLG
ncbi:MAG: FAD-dependent oxidoreductase [Clostridia bacterium]|nr:FAD-dependent oxidoreductase [Clostridia bacterium]